MIRTANLDKFYEAGYGRTYVLRRIEVAYSVTGAIENGTTVELQAALASFELPPAGSNVVRLVVRSKPQLEIYADDVKCTHGATIGQIEENALLDRKSTRLNSSHIQKSRMPSSA